MFYCKGLEKFMLQEQVLQTLNKQGEIKDTSAWLPDVDPYELEGVLKRLLVHRVILSGFFGDLKDGGVCCSQD